MRGITLLAAAAALAAILAPPAMATSPLTVSKTAEGKWTRTFTWTIDKSVTPAVHDLQTGQSGTSTYTIVLTKSAGTDSAVTVEGEVCVTNAAGAPPTANLTISDRIVATIPGGSATLASGNLDLSANPVLDGGESYCYPYSFVIVPRADATGYYNDARVTITNDPREPGEPLGPSTTAPFTIPATPTLINNTVNVDDTNPAGDAGPFSSSTSYSYTRTFTCDGDAGEHPNTATIIETGQSDSANVTVRCTPPPDPGCTYTQGYWKTHSKYGPASKPDSTWDLLPSGPDTTFFLSGKTWYQAFWTSPAGNPYYILAHQYMAARLNVLNGTATTPAVDSALAWATTFFTNFPPSTAWTKTQKAAIVAAAATLADYNEGEIGPGHCEDEVL